MNATYEMIFSELHNRTTEESRAVASFYTGPWNLMSEEEKNHFAYLTEAQKATKIGDLCRLWQSFTPNERAAVSETRKDITP